jgi:hypothetical protein
MGFWFWGSIALFVPKEIGLGERVVIAEDASEAIELQACQGRSRPILDSRGVDLPRLNLFCVTVFDT